MKIEESRRTSKYCGDGDRSVSDLTNMNIEAVILKNSYGIVDCTRIFIFSFQLKKFDDILV